MRRAVGGVLAPSLRTYERRDLPGDLLAGLTVAALTVPAALAYAQVAGLPAITGLYAAMLPMAVFALICSSRHVVVGPDASLSAIIAAVLAVEALGDPSRATQLGPLLGLVVGAVFVAMGAARLGFLANFLSKPLLTGFMAGLAIQIFAGQLPAMLGLEVDSERPLPRIWETLREIGSAEPWTLGIAGASLAVLVLGSRWAPRVPGPLVVLVGSTALVAIAGLADDGVQVLGAVPSGIPLPSLPEASWSDAWDLLPGAASIALVGFVSQAIDARTWADRTGHDLRSNRDLLALGAANLAGGFGGGFPVASSSSRTASAVMSGGRTPVLSLVAAALVAAVLIFAAPALENLPEAALGAIITMAVVRLVDLDSFKRLWGEHRVELGIAAVTLLAVVLLGILPGLVVAVVLSLVDVLRRASYPYDAVLGRRAGHPGWFDVRRMADATPEPGLMVYRFDGPLFFANAQRFRARVLELLDASEPAPQWLVIDAAAITDVDATAIEVLDRVLREIRGRGIAVAVARGTARLRDRLQRPDAPLVPHAMVFKTLEEAFRAFSDR